MSRQPITLEFLNRQRAAVDRDKASYTGGPQMENGERVSRNRHTNQRGITYVKSTQRFRTFAHRPFYFYVGTFTDLNVATQARDSAEAQALQLLHRVLPEIKEGAANPHHVAVKMYKVGSKTIFVELRVAGAKRDETFTDYADVLTWLKRQRGQM